MKRVITIVALILLTATLYANEQRPLTSPKSVERWMGEHLRFPYGAKMTKVSQSVIFTLKWDQNTGRVESVEFNQSYYHPFESAIEELFTSDATPNISLKGREQNSLELIFDFAKLLTENERGDFANIESFSYPTYKDDASGDLWMVERLGKLKIMELYNRGVKEVYSTACINENGGEILMLTRFYTKDGGKSRGVKHNHNSAGDADAWQPLRVNGKSRKCYLNYTLTNLENYFNSEELAAAKSINFGLSDDKSSTDEVVLKLDKVATFQGGDITKFRSWVAMNLRYPEQAMKSNITGRVDLNFSVDKNGEIVDINIINSSHTMLEEASIDVIKRSPKWEPAEINGEPIEMSVNMPIIWSVKTPTNR